MNSSMKDEEIRDIARVAGILDVTPALPSHILIVFKGKTLAQKEASEAAS